MRTNAYSKSICSKINETREERKKMNSEIQSNLIAMMKKKIPSDYFLSYEDMEWSLPYFSLKLVHWIFVQAGSLARYHNDRCIAHERSDFNKMYWFHSL